jgi:LysM repeat protein
MDTLSRDSNSSGSILPLVGVIAGGLALVLSIVALVKITSVQKTLTAHSEQIDKIPALETEIRNTSSKSEADVKNIRDGIQGALNSVGENIGAINARITKIEEAQKARAAAPAGGKGGAAAAPTGVLNSDGTYSVAPGDSLSKIARKFATRVDSIEAENPGLDPTKLKVGQKIKIPKK